MGLSGSAKQPAANQGYVQFYLCDLWEPNHQPLPTKIHNEEIWHVKTKLCDSQAAHSSVYELDLTLSLLPSVTDSVHNFHQRNFQVHPKDGVCRLCGLRIAVAAFCRPRRPHWAKTSTCIAVVCSRVWNEKSETAVLEAAEWPARGWESVGVLSGQVRASWGLVHEWGESGAWDWQTNCSDGDPVLVCGKEGSQHEDR